MSIAKLAINYFGIQLMIDLCKSAYYFLGEMYPVHNSVESNLLIEMMSQSSKLTKFNSLLTLT